MQPELSRTTPIPFSPIARDRHPKSRAHFPLSLYSGGGSGWGFPHLSLPRYSGGGLGRGPALKRTKRAALVIAASLAVFAMRSPARADVATFSAVQDASLLGGTDSNLTISRNQSLADPGIFVGTDGQDNPKRGLIEFNIPSKIPVGSIITAVQLSMTVGQVAGSGGGGGTGTGGVNTIGLYDETQAWGQPQNNIGSTNFGGSGHGTAAQAGDATWAYAFSTNTLWTTAPGGNWSTNSAQIGQANSTLTSGAVVTWTSSNSNSAAMVTDVQNWLDNASANFGWLLKNSDEVDATDFDAFWSQQGATAASNQTLAPLLTVTYTTTPEPSGIFLLAAGLPWYLRRNRKSQFSSDD